MADQNETPDTDVTGDVQLQEQLAAATPEPVPLVKYFLFDQDTVNLLEGVVNQCPVGMPKVLELMDALRFRVKTIDLPQQG